MRKNKEKSVERELPPDYPLKKYDAKTRLLAFILGLFIGIAIIVPGVSGSTVAIILGLYTGMLYAIGNILSDFKRAFAFLLPIGIGAVIGFLAGFIIIQKIFGDYMFVIVCLFVGLMIGAVPAILKETKGEKKTPLRCLLFCIGVLIPLAIGAVSIMLSSGSETTETFTSFPLWRYPFYLLLGFVVSVTQIVPGLSATAILMAVGQFKPILNSLHLDYILENPAVIILYACLGIGFLVGMVVISKAFSAMIAKHKATVFFAVTGLSFGSIASMFLNPDIVEVYATWTDISPVFDLSVGGVLLVVGFISSFLLTRYELKHQEKTDKT